MQEIKVAHDNEDHNIELSRDDPNPLVKFDPVQQVDKEDTMDPATTNPGDPPGVDNVVEPVVKTDSIESSDAKEHVGCESEDGSGTGSQCSEPSIKVQETEPIEGLDHKYDITVTTSLSEVAQESERGFSGFDLNEEFCSEEKPESSLSGTHSNSKQRSVLLDIDLNVADEESSVDARKSKKLHLDLNGSHSLSQSCSSSSSSSSKQSLIKNFDLNNAASVDHQKPVISLFGTRVEVNQRDNGSHPNGGFAPVPSMYYYSSQYRPLGGPTPYMVDPRMVPIAPQFAAPFVMNMAGGPYVGPYLGPTGPLQQNMGLNLGLMMNGGNSGGSVSSVVGGKRQEPDGGWEGFPVNYKHQPQWK